MKIDATDEALEGALREYRRLYPEGVVPQEIEEKASLNVVTSHDKEIYTILVCYWLRDQSEPLRFFEAEFNKRNKSTIVVRAEEPDQLNLLDLTVDE